jgi:hypothetical protein
MMTFKGQDVERLIISDPHAVAHPYCRETWTAVASARPVKFKKCTGGAERRLFGSSRLFEAGYFGLEERNALGKFLRGKIIEVLPDLV